MIQQQHGITQAILYEETRKLLEYRQLMTVPKYKNKWHFWFGNKVSWLPQGISAWVQGTNAIYFIHQDQILTTWMRNIIYGRIVCDILNGKAKPNKTRLTVGGDRIQYPGVCGAPTAHLLTVKIMLNSIISTQGDVKHIYLYTPMIKIHISVVAHEQHTRWCYSTLPVTEEGHQQWLHPFQDQKRNVWFPACQMLDTGPTIQETQRTWLLPKSYHTRTMAAQTTKHTVLSCCQWFWCQIHQSTRCQTPPNNINI